MSSVLAVPLLYEACRTAMTLEGNAARMSFGRRQPAQQVNQGPFGGCRIVWVPGKDTSVGTYAPAHRPGRNPRPLQTLLEYVTVYVWGHDATKPDDEMAHYQACRMLHDDCIRIMWHESHTTVPTRIHWYDPTWVYEHLEKVYGYELKFTLEVSCMIPDEENPEVLATYTTDYMLNQP